MSIFSKKELPETIPEIDRAQLEAEISAEIEQKYRENFNFSCLFQDTEEEGIITKYGGLISAVLVMINIIITFTHK